MPKPGIFVLNIDDTIYITSIKLFFIDAKLLCIEQLGLLKFLLFKILNWC